MTIRKPVHVVESERQLAALASAPRQEIVDMIARMQTVSVAELSAALGRAPDSLYFHLRELVRVGLVLQAGFRRRNGRREAMFRALAPQLAMRYGKRARDRNAVTAIVSSMLRLGIRDYKVAVKREDLSLTGPVRDLWALRSTGWLTKSQLREVNALIERLLRDVSRPQGPGGLYGITVLLTPLDHRRRRKRAENASEETAGK